MTVAELKEAAMSSNISLEERLAAVEAAIVEIQKQITVPQPKN